MTAAPSDGLVEQLGQARLDGEPLAKAGSLMETADSAAGYDIQTRLAAWLAGRGQGAHAGYKIGATAKGMQALLGVSGPVYGNILSSNVLRPAASYPCNPDCKPGVECEITFRLGDDLAPSSSPFTRDVIAACIDAVMPAIEIVENRYGDFRDCSIALLTADDFFHKACVLGEPVPNWRDIDLPNVFGRTLVNGELVETGRGEEVHGHPLEAVVWLANKLARRGTYLEAGQIIMTGSMTPVHWIDSWPSQVAIDIEGLGTSSVTLTGRS